MTQADKLWQIMEDRKPHRVDELVREVYSMDGPSIARLSARFYDLKRKYGVSFKTWRDPQKKKLTWYQTEKPGSSEVNWFEASVPLQHRDPA